MSSILPAAVLLIKRVLVISIDWPKCYNTMIILLKLTKLILLDSVPFVLMSSLQSWPSEIQKIPFVKATGPNNDTAG